MERATTFRVLDTEVNGKGEVPGPNTTELGSERW